MFDWLKKNSLTNVSWSNLVEWFSLPPSTGRTITKEKALQVTAVFCACRVIAEDIARMPVIVKKKTVEGDFVVERPALGHPLQQLLGVKPNSWMTSFEFIEFAVFMAVLCGDFIAVKIKVGGKLKELIPVVPGTWSVKRNSALDLIYTVNLEGGLSQAYQQSEIFHLKGPPSFDTFQGADPIALARESIGLAANLEEVQSKMSASGGRPSGVLSTESSLTPEKSALVKKQWTEKFGANGVGGLALLDGGWKFTPMQMTSVDQEHIETRKHQIEEIARTFRVLPSMLMQSDKASTFASAEQFTIMHVVYTLTPWVIRLEQAFGRDILENDPDHVVDIDQNALLQGDFKNQAEYLAKGLGAGGTPAWGTQNEARRIAGLPPVKEDTANQLFNGFQDNAPGDEDTTDEDKTDESQ